MIVVVGGGITGLATAWELRKAGKDVVLLEASDRVGGVIESAMVEGRVLDWGPQRTRMTPPIQRIVDALGLRDEVEVAPSNLELFVYRDGALRRVPTTLGDLMASDVVGPASKLRFLMEPLTAGPDDTERVAAYFRRKIGKPLYESVVGPLFGGLYGSDPADMEVGRTLTDVLGRMGVRRSLFWALLKRGKGRPMARACSFRGGMQALPDALARSLGDAVRLASPVRSLERRGTGWGVVMERGGSILEAEAVVLTAPAERAAAMLGGAVPGAAEALRLLQYNPLALVHLHAETELEGLGFQVALSEPDGLLRGITFNDAIFDRPNLYTAFLGGSRHPEVAEMTDEDLADAAMEGFRRTTGYEARPLAVRRTRMPAWDTSWSALDRVEVPEGLHLAGNWWSRPGLAGRLAEAKRVARELTPRSPQLRPSAGGSAAPERAPEPEQPPESRSKLAPMWALGGVALLFAFAVARLGWRGLGTVAAGLTPGQWLTLALGTAFFVYTEGVIALERRWIPKLVERARQLRNGSRLLHRTLAPLYGMSLIGASRGSLLRAWAGTAAIVGAVILVRSLPDPWRGIVDIAVASALAWGFVAIARSVPELAEE